MEIIQRENESSSNYILVFGGGHVGLQAIHEFSAAESCIVIDSDANCAVAQQLTIHPAISKKEELLDIIRTRQSYLIIGDIEHVIRLISLLLPSYVIPAAPIHMIAHYCEHLLQKNKRTIKFTSLSLGSFLKDELNQNKPKELFLYSGETDFYLSYAAWDEKCADRCPGLPGYCAYHQRSKPITVTAFLKDVFHRMETSFWGYVIESIQINPGIGGILGTDLKQFLDVFQMKLASLPVKDAINVVVGTTCNCHGVISGFAVERI